MRTSLFALGVAALICASGCKEQPRAGAAPSGPPTFSSFDTSSGTNAPISRHSIRLVETDVGQVLTIYQELSGRSLIRSPRVPMTSKITFDNETALTRVEALQALDNVLAANGIVMVYFGTQYVKVIAPSEVASETGPVIELPPDQLPESSSFLVYVVKLKHISAQDAVPALTPFAKLPNSIIGMKDSNILTLRDYSSNVRRMLQVLDDVDRAPGFKKAAEQLFKSGGAPASNPPRRP